MNPEARCFIQYAALRSGVRIISVCALCSGHDVLAQPIPGADENLLGDEQAPLAETRDPEPKPAPRVLARKAKKPPAPKGPLRSRARKAVNDRDVQSDEPVAVHVHLETPVPAALYDVGTGVLPKGAEPPASQLVCHSPCNAKVAVSEGQVFSVWAAKLERSEDFSIPANGPRAVVELEPESPLMNDVGLVFALTGAGLFCAGGAALLGLRTGQDNDGLLVTMGVAAGSGFIVSLIGLPMAIAPRKANVVVRNAAAGEAFAIDMRPEPRAARPWLGEF